MAVHPEAPSTREPSVDTGGSSLPAEVWEPAANLNAAHRVAKVAIEVLKQPGMSKVLEFRDGTQKRHVTIEGWTTLGAVAGVIYGGQVGPQALWCRRIPGGWEACVAARLLDGRTITTAEAQCTSAEQRWRAAEDFAVRSMAETRAAVKAMRWALAWVLVLAQVDIGLDSPEEFGEQAHQEETE